MRGVIADEDTSGNACGDTDADISGDRVVVRRIRAVECVSGLPALVLAHMRFEGSDAIVPEGWVERIEAHLRAGRLHIFIAEEQGQVVGYASLTDELATWTGQGYAHLDCLYLDEDHRGQGIGNQLITAAIDDARRRGLVQVQWQTPAWNRSAITFYERLGATHTAKERFVLTLPLDGACP